MKKKISFRSGREINNLETQFWMRLIAFILDFLILRWFFVHPIILGLNHLIKLFSSEIPIRFRLIILSDNQAKAMVFCWLLFISIMVLYASILESSKLKATLGKLFMRFSVLDTELNRISFTRAFMRNVLKITAIASVLGVGMIDITKKRQGLHDLIAKTIVRRKRVFTGQ